MKLLTGLCLATLLSTGVAAQMPRFPSTVDQAPAALHVANAINLQSPRDRDEACLVRRADRVTICHTRAEWEVIR